MVNWLNSLFKKYKRRKILKELRLAFDICEYTFTERLKVSRIWDIAINSLSNVDYDLILKIKKLNTEQQLVLRYTVHKILNHYKYKL